MLQAITCLPLRLEESEIQPFDLEASLSLATELQDLTYHWTWIMWAKHWFSMVFSIFLGHSLLDLDGYRWWHLQFRAWLVSSLGTKKPGGPSVRENPAHRQKRLRNSGRQPDWQLISVHQSTKPWCNGQPRKPEPANPCWVGEGGTSGREVSIDPGTLCNVFCWSNGKTTATLTIVLHWACTCWWRSAPCGPFWLRTILAQTTFPEMESFGEQAAQWGQNQNCSKLSISRAGKTKCRDAAANAALKMTSIQRNYSLQFCFALFQQAILHTLPVYSHSPDVTGQYSMFRGGVLILEVFMDRMKNKLWLRSRFVLSGPQGYSWNFKIRWETQSTTFSKSDQKKFSKSSFLFALPNRTTIFRSKFTEVSSTSCPQEPPGTSARRGVQGSPVCLRPEPKSWRVYFAEAVQLGWWFGGENRKVVPGNKKNIMATLWDWL